MEAKCSQVVDIGYQEQLQMSLLDPANKGLLN